VKSLSKGQYGDYYETELYVYDPSVIACVKAYWDLLAGFPDPHAIPTEFSWLGWALNTGEKEQHNWIRVLHAGKVGLEYCPEGSIA